MLFIVILLVILVLCQEFRKELCSPLRRQLRRLLRWLPPTEAQRRTDEEDPPPQPTTGEAGRSNQPTSHPSSSSLTSSTIAQSGGRQGRSRTNAEPGGRGVGSSTVTTEELFNQLNGEDNLVNEPNRGGAAVRNSARSGHRQEAGESYEMRPLAPIRRDGLVNSPDRNDSSGG
ncbi:MAG: hypothetical protein Q9174_004002, partial [Haloplaca sp. 1 TL-2023]